MNDSRLQAELRAYLANLIQGIDEGNNVAGINLQIASESDLEQFVRVKTEGGDTLLKILGYNGDTVEDHPRRRMAIGAMQFEADYVLRHQQKYLAVLDLKRPKADLNNRRWVGQVLFYCQQIDAPFGLLFNGGSLKVFLNIRHRPLARYERWFAEEPVLVESQHWGEFLVLDILSGTYEIDRDDLTASDRMLALQPDAVLYGLRIGYPTAYRLGSKSAVPQ